LSVVPVDFTAMKDRTQGMTKRAILRLILTTIEQVEKSVSAASDYMSTALTSLDTQLGELQTRMAADAQALQDAVLALNVSQADSAALSAAAARVSATADLVAGLDMPSAVADPAQPDVTVNPVPADEPVA
jgi:PAB1-binding protein PBP1